MAGAGRGLASCADVRTGSPRQPDQSSTVGQRSPVRAGVTMRTLVTLAVYFGMAWAYMVVVYILMVEFGQVA